MKCSASNGVAIWRAASRRQRSSRNSSISSGSCGFDRMAQNTYDTSMFVIELIYKAPLAAIDANMADHVAFLNTWYASGHFLVSGRKIPRDGGIIIAVGDSRQQI